MTIQGGPSLRLTVVLGRRGELSEDIAGPAPTTDIDRTGTGMGGTGRSAALLNCCCWDERSVFFPCFLFEAEARLVAVMSVLHRGASRFLVNSAEKYVLKRSLQSTGANLKISLTGLSPKKIGFGAKTM